jgi:predicted TIM-barrel fold metal-dependent hydrolase
VKKIDTEEIAESINGTDVFKYKMSYENLKKKFIVVGTVNNGQNPNGQSPNEQEPDKDENTIVDGLFWGVKMYAALGYPPYMSMLKEARDIFPCLGNSYNELKDFYIFCADNGIPITCHGSPQGMTIADPEVYLKEYLKRAENETSAYAKEGASHFAADGEDFAYGLGLIDNFSSPKSWEKVLDTLGDSVNNLRLCLAHLGGKGFFKGEHEEASFYCWFKEIVRMINDKEYNIYTDISCFVFSDFMELPPDLSPELYNEILKKHSVIEKIYTSFRQRVGYYTLIHDYLKPLTDEEKSQAMKLRLDIIGGYCKELLCYKPLNNTVDKLVKLLNDDKNKKLRYRIMFGTDWPMTETKVTGVPEYNSAIFVLLQLVTRKLENGKKFDAWHQFTVINPLRFLGVLKNEDNGEVNDADKEFYVSMEKFKEMKKALLELNEKAFTDQTSNGKMLSETFFELDVKENVNLKINDAFNALETRMDALEIPAAHLIKSGGKFLIIGE